MNSAENHNWSSVTTRITKLWFTPTRGASNWLWLSFFVIVFDQITKAMVMRSIPLYDSVEVLPILKFTHLHNPGAAFSMLADASGWQRWFFITLGIVMSLILMAWLRRIRTPEQTILAVGLSLILGGALGNVIDRVWFGHVIDFIMVHWNDSVFWPFNIADSAISVGAACLLLDMLLEGKREKKAASQSEVKQ